MQDFLSDDFRLLDLGAAGAFIHALEDEFSHVRFNALSSIKSLAMYSEPFAKASIEFLVDMMNDEIDRVRCNALEALKAILCQYLSCLHLEHLKVIAGVLDDSNPDIRNGVRLLLR